MAPLPSISAIVPARNEEHSIARAVESLAEQPEIAEIIVVNDQSTDQTAAILTQLAAQISRLQVISLSEPPPPGWLGKNWAASCGAAQARGAWLLFTDADVLHLPGGAARALADAAAHGVSFVSYSPEQEVGAWWEQALLPVVYSRLASEFAYSRINDGRAADAAANGQYLLLRRELYERIGGHAAVSGELVEDVELARRAKRAAGAIHFAAGRGIARTRMYHSFSAMWEGWKKNLYWLLGRSAGGVAAEMVKVLPWPEAVLFCLAGAWPPAAWVAAAGLAARHVLHLRFLRQNRYPRRGIVYYLPGVLLYAAALLASARAWRRGRVAWKGREYPVRREWSS